MKSSSVVRVLLLASVAGCSLTAVGGRSSSSTRMMYSSVGDPTAAAPTPTIVQVRAYRRSALVQVVAWDQSENAFGLRTSVTRDGTLVGGNRFGDHTLYVTPQYAREMGGFKYASVTEGHLLRGIGAQSDAYACRYGNVCTPAVTYGVRLPDTLLRAHRDGLVVTFHPPIDEPWTLTLGADLIGSYLAEVDSVVAEMKEPAAK